MKRIKLGLLLGAVLVSSMALASGDMKEAMHTVTESVVSNLDIMQKGNDIELLPEYDYDKNVPPSFDVLRTKVGKKDEIEIFIPKVSIRYISYFIVDHKDARDFREKYYRGLGNESRDKSEDRAASSKRGFANPDIINKLTFYKNGVLAVINVKDSPYTEFSTGDLDSDFDVKYTYGRGYVLKAELVTSTKSDSDESKLNYVVNEYKTALKNKGFSYESLFGYIQENPLYAKDETIVGIEVYKMSLAVRLILNYRYDNAIMSIYDKDTFNNYAQIEADIKKKDYDVEFTKLGRILNN